MCPVWVAEFARNMGYLERIIIHKQHKKCDGIKFQENLQLYGENGS